MQEENLVSKATVVIVAYNHRDHIQTCLASVIQQNPEQVIVVDSGSTDGTQEVIHEEFPEVHLLESTDNRGFGAANNLAATQVETEYIVFLNPDTKVSDGSLAELIKPLKNACKLITTPKILNYGGDAINTCGNSIHFTGLGFTRGLGSSPDTFDSEEPLSGISGACFATRTSTFRELGGFDDSIFLYMEDVELSWRCALNDVEILYVPDAVVYHDYDGVSMTPEKLYHVERGRYLILRKHLTLNSIILLTPALIMTELLTTTYALLLGLDGLQKKVSAIKWGLSVEVDSGIKRPSKILPKLEARIPEEQLSYGSLDRAGKGIANKLYALNYRLVVR